MYTGWRQLASGIRAEITEDRAAVEDAWLRLHWLDLKSNAWPMTLGKTLLPVGLSSHHLKEGDEDACSGGLWGRAPALGMIPDFRTRE